APTSPAGLLPTAGLANRATTRVAPTIDFAAPFSELLRGEVAATLRLALAGVAHPRLATTKRAQQAAPLQLAFTPIRLSMLIMAPAGHPLEGPASPANGRLARSSLCRTAGGL